jgi:uncharacterized protein DUF1018
MKRAKTSPSRRNSDLAMIHIAAKRLFGDVSKGADGRAGYEDWLVRHTGKRSAGKLTTPERIALIKVLRKEGLIPERERGGIGQTQGGDERPTSAQWAKIGGLARSMGWEKGLEDVRLRSFVVRTAKVNSTRFITRSQASKVILGLEEWVRQRAASPKGGTDAMP